MSFAGAVLLVALCGCAYAYAGYPLLLIARALLGPRPPRRSGAQPFVTLIVPAHNEEHTIGAKLRCLAALRYPAGRLEIIVASDGSTDATETMVRAASRENVRLLPLDRRGKLAALDAAVQVARGDLLVFSDANVALHPDALRYLVQPFADPEVGCVCGEKRSADADPGDATGRGEGLYWRYDAWVKRLESAAGTMYGADGALYAIRQTLYRPPAELAQADDLAISGRVALQGYRIVYEPRALCFETMPRDGWIEFRRKVRVANHTLRAIVDLARIQTHPLGYWWTLASHKLARYAVPVFLAIALAATAALAPGHLGFLVLLELQVAFYVLAGAGWMLRARPAGRLGLLSVPYYFSLINAAALVGVLTLLRGRRTIAWTPRAS